MRSSASKHRRVYGIFSSQTQFVRCTCRNSVPVKSSQISEQVIDRTFLRLSPSCSLVFLCAGTFRLRQPAEPPGTGINVPSQSKIAGIKSIPQLATENFGSTELPHKPPVSHFPLSLPSASLSNSTPDRTSSSSFTSFFSLPESKSRRPPVVDPSQQSLQLQAPFSSSPCRRGADVQMRALAPTGTTFAVMLAWLMLASAAALARRQVIVPFPFWMIHGR